MAFCWRCSFAAFAKVLDQFSGIECYSGTAVGVHLQKFWIRFAESNVIMTLERHFGRPDGAKLALEQRSEQPCGAKLALERRFASPCGVKLTRKWQLARLEWHFSSPGDANVALERRLRCPRTPANEIGPP